VHKTKISRLAKVLYELFAQGQIKWLSRRKNKKLSNAGEIKGVLVNIPENKPNYFSSNKVLSRYARLCKGKPILKLSEVSQVNVTPVNPLGELNISGS
jgi:hypothetical protein